jgi:TolA-binding protein
MDWLKELLTSNNVGEEDANKIIEAAKKESPKYFVPKADFNTKNEEAKNLTAQINSLNTEVENLKKIDPTKLQDEITRIQNENTKLQDDHKKELDKVKFDSALDLAIASSKSIDPVALKAHIKVENLKYDEKENKIIGFDDQLKSIKDSQKYLFEIEPDATGERHDKLPGGETKDLDLSSALKEKYKN